MVVANTARAEGEFFSLDSDGARIEEEIQLLATNCFGKYAKYGPTFLPPEFKSQFGLGQALRRKREPDRVMKGLQFDYIARTVFDLEKPILSQIMNAAGRTLPIDIRLSAATAIAEANSTVYGLTCSSQMKTALDQGFEFSFSLFGNASAGIKQALDFQSNSEARNSILLMNGVFWSPLHLALTSKNPEARARAHAAVLGYLLSI